MSNYEFIDKTVNNLFLEVIEAIPPMVLEREGDAISIPEEEMDKMDRNSLALLVAKTSNVHSKAARLAGIAWAEYKLAHQAYKRKFRTSKTGRNEAEREANATEATEEEAERVATAEAVISLAQGVETAARVASESARKILDKADSISKSDARGQAGYQRIEREPSKSHDFDF